MKSIALVLMACILTACSASEKLVNTSASSGDAPFTEEMKLTAQLRSPQVQPVSLEDLSYQLASLDSTNRIDITAESPIVHFAEGNSFVSALFLPPDIKRFTFNLESSVGSTVFVPSVIFLDENFQQVSRIDNATYNPKGYFSIEQVINPENAKAVRYILVYSKQDVLGGKTEIVNVARAYELEKGNAVSDIALPKLYAQHSPVGRLKIRFDDLFYSASAIHNHSLTSSRTDNLSTAPTAENMPKMLSDTEAFYLHQISKAVSEGNDLRAKRLLDEAVRAGSVKARSHYQKALESNK